MIRETVQTEKCSRTLQSMFTHDNVEYPVQLLFIYLAFEKD